MKISENLSVNESEFHRITPYNPFEETTMKTVYNQFSEKDRRLYAGAEAIKLPHGGITYIADL